MAWRSHVLNFRSLGCLEPSQEHPPPPSPSWILWWQMVSDVHSAAQLCPGGVMFQISVLWHKWWMIHTSCRSESTVWGFLSFLISDPLGLISGPSGLVSDLGYLKSDQLRLKSDPWVWNQTPHFADLWYYEGAQNSHFLNCFWIWNPFFLISSTSWVIQKYDIFAWIGGLISDPIGLFSDLQCLVSDP